MKSKEQTLALKKKYRGSSLSLLIDEPLKIVRGKAQYLYDENGRKYLVCVNNISHVGFCHPAVIKVVISTGHGWSSAPFIDRYPAVC